MRLSYFKVPNPSDLAMALETGYDQPPAKEIMRLDADLPTTTAIVQEMDYPETKDLI